jgi:hypothetical protein
MSWKAASKRSRVTFHVQGACPDVATLLARLLRLAVCLGCPGSRSGVTAALPREIWSKGICAVQSCRAGEARSSMRDDAPLHPLQPVDDVAVSRLVLPNSLLRSAANPDPTCWALVDGSLAGATAGLAPLCSRATPATQSMSTQWRLHHPGIALHTCVRLDSSDSSTTPMQGL